MKLTNSLVDKFRNSTYGSFVFAAFTTDCFEHLRVVYIPTHYPRIYCFCPPFVYNMHMKNSHLLKLEETRRRANCRSYTNVYIRRGRIKKLPCEVCGNIEVEVHHENYSNPLQIRWLCKRHHRDVTNRNNFISLLNAAAERHRPL